MPGIDSLAISIPDISFILSLRFPPPSDPNSTYPNEEFLGQFIFPITFEPCVFTQIYLNYRF